MSPQRTSTTMELLPLVCLCLLSCSGDAVRVEEGSDAVLPCLISNKDLEGKFFDWKKDGQKEVFLYDAGNHYKNGRPGQDEQFKGRVEHFQDQLQNGNASIKITRTKMADSGNYSCDFPRLQPRQTFIIELVVDPRDRVLVKEGSDAVLPCSPNPKVNLTGQVFDWKKDGQDVFIHYSDGRTKGADRVKHLKNELENGNASIKITNTEMNDSGIYSCHFPDLQSQTFHIKLDVGAAPEPNIKTLDMTNHWALLQCEAHGDPLPTVEWKDSDNNTLNADTPQISERGGRSYITVKITVTKTGRYRCVATQEKFSHQIDAATFVRLPGAASEPSVTIIETDEGTVLQCKVLGASPKPKVEWKDSSGNILPVKDLKETENGGLYDIVLQAAVTKTDNFRCVVTQEGIDSPLSAKIHAAITGSNTVVVLSLLLVVVSIVAVVAIVLYLKNRNKQHCKKGEKKIDGEKTDSEAKPLNPPEKSEKKIDGEKTDPAAKPLNPPEKNPGSTPNAANGQPDTEENTAV